MTDEEILKIDFYDLCGIGELGMSDQDKITIEELLTIKNRL